MIFNGALADVEIRGYILAGMPSHHELHDLTLPGGEVADVTHGSLVPRRQSSDQFILLTRQGAIRTLISCRFAVAIWDRGTELVRGVFSSGMTSAGMHCSYSAPRRLMQRNNNTKQRSKFRRYPTRLMAS